MLPIFQSSVENYSVRYTEFLGDGDSKAHKLIVEKAVYGDVEVKKLECVDHVQKRLGSRLWSLKKDGKTLGGTGRLSESRINKLQIYYGNAIRDNTHKLEVMQNAVMAIWHHSQSTDERMDGENTWCRFQRDIAKGTSDNKHEHPLPKAVANAILPTLEALSDEDLLARCLHGALRTKMRPSMPSSSSGQLKKLTLV